MFKCPKWNRFYGYITYSFSSGSKSSKISQFRVFQRRYWFRHLKCLKNNYIFVMSTQKIPFTQIFIKKYQNLIFSDHHIGPPFLNVHHFEICFCFILLIWVKCPKWNRFYSSVKCSFFLGFNGLIVYRQRNAFFEFWRGGDELPLQDKTDIVKK